MFFSFTKLLLLGTILSRVTAQDDDDSGFGDDDDGNGFGAVDEGIAQSDTQQSCDMILNQCPGGFPASNFCVQNWCSNGCADPYQCCTHLQSAQQACFQQFIDSNGGSGGSNGTAGGKALPSACAYISTQISECESSTSGFSTLANTDQASCICFNTDGSWNGTLWDNAATTCYQAISSAGSANASVLSDYDSGVVGLCTKFVDAGILSSAGVSDAASNGAGAAASTTLPSSTSVSGGGGVAASGQPSSAKDGGSGAVAGSSASKATPSPTQKGEAESLMGQRSKVIAAIALIVCALRYY